MKPTTRVSTWVLMTGLILGPIGYSEQETVWAAEPIGGTTQAAEPAARTWSGGGSIGFLANTPDDTAFAFNLHADRL